MICVGGNERVKEKLQYFGTSRTGPSNFIPLFTRNQQRKCELTILNWHAFCILPGLGQSLADYILRGMKRTPVWARFDAGIHSMLISWKKDSNCYPASAHNSGFHQLQLFGDGIYYAPHFPRKWPLNPFKVFIWLFHKDLFW